MNKIEIARWLAKQAHRDSDDVQFDDDAQVSPVDCGMWVQAWVFVRSDDIEAEQARDESCEADHGSPEPMHVWSNS